MTRTLQSVNPATGETLKSYWLFSPGQIQEVLEQSQSAFASWSRTALQERSRRMEAVAQVLRKNKDDYARTMALEMGKPLAQGVAEVEKCAWAAEFYSEEAEGFLAPEPIPTEAQKSYVAFDPLGVLLAVMPWNFPFWQVFRCAVPAVLAGNTVVLKHASNVPECALAIEKVFEEAGFPPGTFRTVLADSRSALRMIEHPAVRAVSLTGSTQAGKSIAKKAGEHLKKTVLELGGSDPYLILEDADLEKAAETCARARLVNSGQSCIAAKRFIVVGPVRRRFEEVFVEKMRAQKMGPPLQEGIGLGPLARADLRDALHAQVEKSVEQGARVLLGGSVPDSPGAYYPPTVLTDVRKGMPAYKEETFGPVAAVIPVETEEEAVRTANDSVYGLGAAVFTRDAARGERLARQELQAGSVFVNDQVHSDPRLPFGGIKESGYGRELSAFGIREFTNIKTVFVKNGEKGG